MKILADKGAALEAVDAKGNTALMLASQYGRLEAVAFLLEKGAAVEAKDSDGTTPLMAATMNDHVDVMKLLLDKGAAISATTNSGFDALVFATDDKRIDALNFLLEKGAPVDAPAPAEAGLTSLMHAASDGQLEAMKVLLEKGAALEAKDKDGWTPLLAAAQAGKLESVNLLLEKGAAINSRANDGSTPLLYAAYNGHLDVVKALLEKGANVAARDHDGSTAYILAEIMDHADVVEFLRGPTAAAFASPPALDEATVLSHLIDQAGSDGFASLRGDSRTTDSSWDALTMPVGAQDCYIDWNAKVGDSTEVELYALMLVTKNHDDAAREFLRVRDVVARAVPWKDARHGQPDEDNFRMFFEPAAEGQPHRTIVVRFDQHDDENGAYFVQLQIAAPLAPSWYRQVAQNRQNNMAGYVADDVKEFLAVAAQGFESYKTGDATDAGDGLRRWESSRKPALASYADVRQLGETTSYVCTLGNSAYKGELLLQYQQLVSQVAIALPGSWSKAADPPFGGTIASIEFDSTDGMKGQIWMSFDPSTSQYTLSFQIVSNQQAPAATAATKPAQSPSEPFPDDPIGSGGFITPPDDKRE
jgi:ankyrin repeat protein